MRYGLISDVHGNFEALAVVLDKLASLKVDACIFLGDAVGYGASPNEVCELLRRHATIGIVGNHDAAVSGRMDYDEYYDAARQALTWCTSRLSSENKSWLAGLPYKHREGFMEFSHGAPLVPEAFDYLFAADQASALLGKGEELAPVTFVGHSHLTTCFRLEGARLRSFVADRVECDAGAKYIITVGSVGQPRDRDPRACCGVFDTDRRLFTFHRLEYDIHGARQKIIDAGLAPVFGDRLLVGV
jgi:diadenosine tetraphosphatase ApaH/serine/threonine PP2A family protein phosphatase